MTITVIIPVYNAEPWLRQCLDSILNQTFRSWQLILVDDGSTDASGSILDEYAAQNQNITVIHQQNAGVSAARNEALRHCTGDWVYIMDADDYLSLDALQTMMEAANQTQADIIITDHVRFTDSNIEQPCHFFPNDFVTSDPNEIDALQRMVLHRGYSPFPTPEDKGIGLGAPWTKLIRRSLITDHNLTFDSRVKGVFDDGLFALNIFEHATKVAYTRQITIHIRTVTASLTHRFRPNQLEIYDTIYTQIKTFGQTHQKSNPFWRAFDGRILLYLGTAFDTYFFHKSYPQPTHTNYREFKETLHCSPYREAIQQAEYSKLGKREKRIVSFSRMHLTSLLWMLERLRRL